MMKSKSKRRTYLPDTFGDPTRYRTLPYISEKLNEIDISLANKMAKLIFAYFHGCKNIQEMSDYGFRNNMLNIVRQNAHSKLDLMAESYPVDLVSRVHNLFDTKFKILSHNNTREQFCVRSLLNTK